MAAFFAARYLAEEEGVLRIGLPSTQSEQPQAMLKPAGSLEKRFSDHAPVVIDYDFTL